MQQPTPAPAPVATVPVPPAPPLPPGIPVEVRRLELAGVPRTAAEMRALKARRHELSNQLTSVAERREELAEELKSVDPGARAGLEKRIAMLDERIIQIEGDIAESGRLVAMAPPVLQANSESAPAAARGGAERMENGQITAIAIVFTLFVLMPIAIALAVRIFRRGAAPAPSPRDPETHQRLARMEQAVDAIAIEVERISEGQRFVTQLLAEQAREKAALPRGISSEV